MNNVIGGINVGDGNVISFNGDGTTVPTLFGEAGIAVFAGATNNPIYGNGIVSNTGAGIDLGISDADGVTANDPLDVDSGNGNNLQNFPSLTSASSSSTTTTIGGTLDSTASTTFRVEFFSSVAADAGGNGEGRVFLGSTNVTTNVAGNATISFVSQIRVSGGQVVTATATNPNGDTSEFSNAQTVTGAVTAAGVSVSGSARTAQGKRIRNAQITMTSIEGNVRTTFTNAFGNFKFTDVAAGQTHVFSIRSKTYTFEQPSQVVNLSEDVDNLDFIATPRGRTN
ncbi:MAG: hypothetical protein H7Z37_06750 [Pyrinomonadaceae bacterium]|nr:hypothetical protein [Pyrinomonadaceae bacterium]